MDLNDMYISCLYVDEWINMPTSHLRPGRSISATTACELPGSKKYVQIEVVLSYETEAAIFAGDVK
ncbi:hypothetical protein [Streptomyces purpurogeneiscleroticus]|uniref:hypothetical protein n=1 Tax=Streptomyces purpurogeneiscleroticus TaxID=68259 RepID=UPI001CC0816C|nr:hypothetical protein [Streptomyces purpurogeneiscleroticus]MBZ4017510.1 hypothetical protein [Streptomyces purpurogeneiscleroticus]